jgi:hypothetical protein
MLLARRSWRRFGEGTIPLATCSTLHGLTSGVQKWVDVPGQGRVALKRSNYSRAYRAPLVEAGHLFRPFCLLATSYGLAPFCAMALGDKAIEQDLQLDGISKSVLYAAGVAIRPTGLAWAPAPEGLEAPRTVVNPYLRPSVDQ